jgi:hypothetical protein
LGEQGGVRAVEVIVVEVERETLGAVVTGVIGTGVGPLAGEGLDEAFGLAIGLRAIGTGEEMFEAELEAGGGKELGAIGGAAVGEDGLDGDPMILIEGQGLVEGGQDAGDFFVGEEGGKSDSGVVVDGDVEGLHAGARVAVGTVAGGADAGVVKAAKLFNIKMKEFAGRGAFVADDGRFGRFERAEAIETVALEDAGEGGFGDGENHEDLGVGTALAAEGQDLIFEVGRGLARLDQGHRGVVFEPERRAGELGTFEPFADGFIGDGEGGGGGAQRRACREVMGDHFGSHERGEGGISVHVVRGVWRAVAR